MTLDELRSDLLGEHALLRNRLAYIRRLTRTEHLSLPTADR